MSILKFALRYLQYLIYIILLVTLLYFPSHELFSYFSRETRLFELRPMLPVDDALLPCLLLALLNGIVSVIRRKIDPPGMQGEIPQCSPGD
jgi:hypothetical protein